MFVVIWVMLGWAISFGLASELEWWKDPFTNKFSMTDTVVGLLVNLVCGGLLGPLAFLPKLMSGPKINRR